MVAQTKLAVEPSDPDIEPGRHRALVVTESYEDTVRIGKMVSSFLRSAGYDVTQVEDYHVVLHAIRSGDWFLVVYAGLRDILGRDPAVHQVTDGARSYNVYAYESRDFQIIEEMRPDPQVLVPRIVFRTVKMPFGTIVWHGVHLPGIALVETPLRKHDFLAVVADVTR